MLGGLGVVLASYAVVTLGPVGSSGLQDAFGRWAYDLVLLGAAGAILLRAIVVPAERRAWLSLGIGVLLWSLGQTYYSVVLYYASPAPVPSPADGLFLAFYPASYLALVLLLRARSKRVDPFAWVDALIAALAVAAVAAALIFPPVLEAIGGSTLGVAVSLAYPCADLVLLGLLAAALTTSRWWTHGTWLLFAAAIMLFGVSDVVYLSVGGQSTDALNIASIGWPLAFLLLAWAAWRPSSALRPAPEPGARSIVLSLGLATTVIALLAVGSFVPVGSIAVGFGVASLLAVLARLSVTFSLNTRILASSQEEAVTDALTGLANRRSLMVDLNRAVATSPSDPMLLALFDLNGFKTYNDSFGHAAGDDLLRRLGASLREAMTPWGKAYRLGGDEFCVLVSTRDATPETIVRAGEGALFEQGPGFSIQASYGIVKLPAEAAAPTDALRLADRRMYTTKGRRADSAVSQARSVLLGLLREREPELDRHLNGVAGLASALGRALRLDAEDLDVVVRAAEMHDIGKIAIPDEILHKEGPLSEGEWSLMRNHTLIGERVLAAAPALREVAGVVRSSHERWDGSGYPDGLAGEEIPLGARIILICDAFSSMTSGRPYEPALTTDHAAEELRRCAGTQFDPKLVEVFIDKLVPEIAASESNPSPIEVTGPNRPLDSEPGRV
ncbi:MAG: HD domain-containing phosphohydrolase [Solirubrobacterales bacterium]